MFIKVRAEEILIGGVLGAGLGLAMAAPLATGMPSLIPQAVEGAWGLGQTLLALGLATIGASAGAWFTSRQERDSHQRGAQFFPRFDEARRRLQAIETRQFSAAQAAGKVHGITIGGVQLSCTREVGHVYAVGLPGAGKTVVLTAAIDQALHRGDRVILHDPKGDFIERYYDPQTTVLLGPWDERAAIWDAAADIDSPALADEFGAAVCGAGPQAGQNRFFHDAAGILLAGLIRSYQRGGRTWTWSDLTDALASDPFKLIRQAAEGNSQVKTAFPSAFAAGGQLTQGERAALSVLATSSAWLTNYAALDAADPDRPRFSLRKWLTREDHVETRIVIFNSHAQYQSACESIFGAMLSTIAATVSSPVMPEISADEPGGVWMFLDEFPQLGAVALGKIQQIAELGRSRGLREVLALQDETQLEAKVGREKAAPMLAVQSTRIYMRSSDKTAESVSKRIGEREILRIDTTAQDGAVAGKTKRAEKQTVIQPSDLLGLRVRTKEPPRGVELVMHIEDTLGRLVQPFPPRVVAKAPRLVESETWRRGSLPSVGVAAAGGGAEQPCEATPSMDDAASQPKPEEVAEPDSTKDDDADDTDDNGPPLF